MASLGRTGRDADETIDLREDVAGRPGRCPLCGDRGYLDWIDLRAGVQLEHCVACECRWKRSIENPAAGVKIIGLPKD